MKNVLWFAALLFVTFGAPESSQAQVACGDEIDSDGPPVVVLTRDLFCGGDSSDEVLELDGPVTLEMRGRTITCIGDRNDGFRLTGTRARLIGPGSIVNCHEAVTLTGGGFHTVQGVTLIGDSSFTDAIIVFSRSNTIKFNTIRNFGGDAIELFSGADFSRINRNRAAGIGGNGIDVVSLSTGSYAESILISRNVFTDVEDTGIEVGPRTRVINNTVQRAGEDGISMLEGAPDEKIGGARILNNRVIQAGENGIRLQFDTERNVIRRNVVMNSGEHGILLTRRSVRNKILLNQVRQSGGFDMVDENFNCGRNEWSRNSFGTRNRGRSCIQ